MAYREALMADARKWGDAVFASSIRILEVEYRKAERREAVRQTFAELFGQWREKAASLGICFLALFDTLKEERVSYYCPVLVENESRGKPCTR